MNQQAEGPYKVFISFKSVYKPMAEKFRNQLALLGGNDIEINISTDIAAGKNWREWIREKIIDSNLLILLFTAPRGTWDWCLYEVGLFREPANLDKRPVVCIHNPNYNRPDPIKDLQSVKADMDGLKYFLKSFYGTTNITKWHKPLNKAFSNNKNEVERVANLLRNAFKGEPPEKVFINKYMIITVKNAAAIKKNEIPTDAIIQSNARSLELFRLTVGKWKWGDLKRITEQQGDSEWIGELAQAIYEASQRKLPTQIKSTFKSPGDAKVYRPVLYRVDYGTEDESISFYVLFVIDKD